MFFRVKSSCNSAERAPGPPSRALPARPLWAGHGRVGQGRGRRGAERSRAWARCRRLTPPGRAGAALGARRSPEVSGRRARAGGTRGARPGEAGLWARPHGAGSAQPAGSTGVLLLSRGMKNDRIEGRFAGNENCSQKKGQSLGRRLRYFVCDLNCFKKDLCNDQNSSRITTKKQPTKPTNPNFRLEFPKTSNQIFDSKFRFWNCLKPDQLVGFRR